MTRSGTTRARLITRRAVTIAAALTVTAGLSGAAAAATTHAAHARAAAHITLAAKNTKVNDEVGEKGVCANCSPPLVYHNGLVMGAGTPAGTITVTPVYWVPAGYSFAGTDATYTSLVNQYITDIAAASGTTNETNAILPEYYQTANGVTTNVKNSFAAGTAITDTSPYPATGQCTPVPYPGSTNPLVTSYTACITDAQVQAELTSLITAKSLPTGLSNLYVMLFPPNVETQQAGTPAQYSNANYCGYHSAYKMGSNTVIYANEPFPVYCWGGSTPNNDVYGDMEISTLSHEISEAVTDPLNPGGPYGWYDSAGNEIGDECAYNYGTPLGTVSTASYGAQPYNQVINGHDYWIQTEFSNAAYAATGIGTGCRQTAYGSGGNIPRRHGVRHDTAGLTSMVTVDPSPATLPADGSSTSTITVTATDSSGDPVAGDTIAVFTRDDNATPGGCGTLSNGQPGPGSDLTTNAAGQVTVTYTASTVSSDCYILATDTTAGMTDQAVIYQGSEDTAAPSITESTLPAQLVSGGPSADFTATATNPSSSNGGSDIADARFGVYITGDDNGSAGINASQITLAYKDDQSQGDYVNVPLSGTTANGGQISGLVSPDTTEALAPGATRHADFELTLAGNAAADTATTGNNLQVQIVLDQIDPADGSLSNLDATTPGGVPVVQEPGHTVTYSGKLVTTSQPSGSNPGTASLEAKDCHFTSDNNAACRITGTESFTASGGTLTGTITTDPAPGVADLVINFTETFTTTPGGGTGTGTGQVIYFDNGNSTNENLSAVYQTTQDKKNPNVMQTQGTLTFANPTP